MSLAEGQALAYQIIGQIGSIGEVVSHSLSHLIHIHGHGENHITIYSQGEFHSVDSVEEALLVLLQILVIGQGQSLRSGQHSHQMTIDTTGLTAYQLGNIRVFLLGHHGRASRKGIIQLHKAKLSAAPQANLLA